ncbi:MAG TPA: hypothetical protein VF189_03050, partial [Patescibacteria group bacterium]
MEKFSKIFKDVHKKFEEIIGTSPHLSIIALTLLIIGLSLFIFNKLTLVQMQFLQVKKAPFVLSKPSYIPILEKKYFPEISAKAAYVMEDNTKMVLYSKREDLRFSPASTTKIMTALVGLDYYKLNDILTIQRSNVIPVVVGFSKGVGVTFENLLYGMFLPSGNDAAYAVGDNYPGGIDGFAQAMNKKAKELHLT